MYKRQLVARGYYQAFQAVRGTISDILKGKNAGEAVRAVLGHFFFVYIHPYMDGNGRMGRFVLNAMLASGGRCV